MEILDLHSSFLMLDLHSESILLEIVRKCYCLEIVVLMAIIRAVNHLSNHHDEISHY